MAKDSIGDRFAKTLQKHRLAELSKRSRSREDLEAEEELIKSTEKVKPLHADGKLGRNSPCPCGSGKKDKKSGGREA